MLECRVDIGSFFICDMLNSQMSHTWSQFSVITVNMGFFDLMIPIEKKPRVCFFENRKQQYLCSWE